MNKNKLEHFIRETWDEDIIPALIDYIKIPCKSQLFDKDWKAHGFIDEAMNLLQQWAKKHSAQDMRIEVIRLNGLSPLLFIAIPGSIDETVLLYGHMDKQPEMTGWHEGLGPWTPVIKDGKLYGRGGADDGYALFASLTAIRALQEQGLPHARCVIIIESAEESHSEGLVDYIEHLKTRIGNPNFIICLDSGCGNYEQLWSTTSLRGAFTGVLSIDILKEGIHSGAGSGAVASSFRILRQLLSRIEDETTGKILVDECETNIPEQRLTQITDTANILGVELINALPLMEGALPMADSPAQLLLQKTWMPTLSVTGIEGIPPLNNSGNVLRPFTRVKLSFRLPPTCDAKKAEQAIKQCLEKNPPYGAKVSFTPDGEPGAGWNAPALAPWLEQASENASQAFFSKPAAYIGEGGTIPFMGMLGKKFPKAQFLIAGVLGPKSNAHGPNEFLHIEFAKKLTCCVSAILSEHAVNCG
jgi:acetylornithine deacetylase/succinyl-diaminopimelate desuccinylase-like protein